MSKMVELGAEMGLIKHTMEACKQGEEEREKHNLQKKEREEVEFGFFLVREEVVGDQSEQCNLPTCPTCKDSLFQLSPLAKNVF